MASSGVDQTGTNLAFKDMIQAGLIASDTGIDFIRSVFGSFFYEFGICQKRTGHRYHIGIASGQHIFCNFRGVDTVAGHQREGYIASELGGDPGEGRPGHNCCDGWNSGLMPANAGIDDGCASLFYFSSQDNDFIPRAAVFHQIQHGEPINDNKIGTHFLTHTSDNFDREADSIFKAAAPTVGSLVGF